MVYAKKLHVFRVFEMFPPRPATDRAQNFFAPPQMVRNKPTGPEPGPPKLQKRQKQQKRVQSGPKQAESVQSGWILEQPGEAHILSH